VSADPRGAMSCARVVAALQRQPGHRLSAVGRLSSVHMLRSVGRMPRCKLLPLILTRSYSCPQAAIELKTEHSCCRDVGRSASHQLTALQFEAIDGRGISGPQR
jgi:hypothetical protein